MKKRSGMGFCISKCGIRSKANEVTGNKKDNITIVYTPWSNLKKDGSMVTGQVGFKDQRKVRKSNIMYLHYVI